MSVWMYDTERGEKKCPRCGHEGPHGAVRDNLGITIVCKDKDCRHEWEQEWGPE